MIGDRARSDADAPSGLLEAQAMGDRVTISRSRAVRQSSGPAGQMKIEPTDETVDRIDTIAGRRIVHRFLPLKDSVVDHCIAVPLVAASSIDSHH